MFVFTENGNIVNLKVIHSVYIRRFGLDSEKWCVVYDFGESDMYFTLCQDREHAETIMRKIHGCIIGGHPWCKITAEDVGMEESNDE